MSKVYGSIELIGGGEVLNLVSERVVADPTFDAADEGVIIYNTTESAYKYNNGASWVTFEISLTSSVALIETLGDNWINPDFSFDPTDFNSLDNVDGLTAADSLFSVIVDLDTAITAAKTVETLQGVPLDFVPLDLTAGNVIFFNGTSFIPGTVNDLDTVELNLGELQDVTLTDPENQEFSVFANGTWVNKPIFHKFEELSGTLSTFTVNHSLGEQFCHVTVIDMSFSPPRKMSEAEITSIEYNSANTATVTITSTKPVTILVSTVAIAA